MNFKRPSTKHRGFLTAIIMSFSMALSMSFFLTWINTGLSFGFIHRWAMSFSMSICIAFPVSLIVGPLTNRFLNSLFKEGA